MRDFQIKIVGLTVGVHGLQAEPASIFQDYLTDEKAEYEVQITQTDIDFEREKSRQEDAFESIPARQFSDAYLETIAIQRKITELLFDHDTILFHGSVIAVDGVAYLFTAKSGTGKSTHTRLWREFLGQRAVMVNDDKPFLKICDDHALACGTPWNGKHRLGCNMTVPLRAICILERGEINEIQPIAPKEAVYMLLQQSQRPMDRSKMGKYFDLLDRLSANVAFYRLKCNMDIEAAQVAFAAMSGKDE